MELMKEDLSNQENVSSPELFRKFLESQKELFHNQINEFQSIVVTQCRLTGVNPLSQEMAAGAMSVKIGKRPRDLLNPKVVKYLQAIFSVKDTISKTECRDISRNFCITVTQIREFFASQRTRVRRLIRQSREKTIGFKALEDAKQDTLLNSESPMPIDSAPLNSIAPISVDEAPSCSTPNDELTNMNDLDREFVDSIFVLMRKEESFCGQEKLMKWILQIQNSSVLSWFLSKGGVMIIATWLSEAAAEEQTSVLFVILEVLSHLPLHKALPAHVSAIMQSVNKLRFYRTPDVSNRAKALLSKWFKTFPRSQALKKPNGVKSFARRDRMLNQSIGEAMGDEVWRSHIGITEEILACSNENLEDARKSESPQVLKLLPASTDDSNKKHTLGLSSSQTRERRKIQLVEQPGQKTAGRSSQASRSASVSQSRPISVDDIQKAKMRALYKQNKYGKSGSSVHETNGTKIEATKKPVVARTGNSPPVPKVHIFPKVEKQKSSAAVPHKVPGISFSVAEKDSGEPIWWESKRAQIPWQMPPEFKLNDLWRVSCGDDSKEVGVQKNRNRREKETVDKTVHEIPLNPKEPWDREMDYDDSLTPEIPLEQLPDADVAETQVAEVNEDANRPISTTATTSSSLSNRAVSAEPDLELLAVLLKNPELVFALTSGQAAANLSNQDTVRLLDVIKAGGAGLFSNANGVNNGRKEEKIEVSLPSPTPSSNPGTGMSALDAVKNPFSRQGLAGSRSGYPHLAAATAMAIEKSAPTIPALPQVSTSITLQQRLTNVSSLQHPTQAATLPFPSLQTAVSEAQPQSLHRNSLSNSLGPSRAAEVSLSMKNASASVTSFPNPSSTAVSYPPEKSTISFPSAQSSSSPSPSPATMTFPPQARQYHQQESPIYTQSQAVKPPYHRSVTSGKHISIPNSLRDGLSFREDHYSQADRPSLNAPYGGGFMQPHLQTCPPREREQYTGRNEYDSWSPENNLNRQGNMAGRNFLEPRMDPGQPYRSDRSRQRDLPLYRDRDYDRHGKRWLKDRRH